MNLDPLRPFAGQGHSDSGNAPLDANREQQQLRQQQQHQQQLQSQQQLQRPASRTMALGQHVRQAPGPRVLINRFTGVAEQVNRNDAASPMSNNPNDIENQQSQAINKEFNSSTSSSASSLSGAPSSVVSLESSTAMPPSVAGHWPQRRGQHQAPSSEIDEEMAAVYARTLDEVVKLKIFLISAPANFLPNQVLNRFPLPSDEVISCICWNNVFYVTGTDIVRILSYRFEAFGRVITNRKKFEEGIFSDLRNLKCDTDAILEEPKSDFLEFLYKNNCVRTQKKQKVFYWFSVQHDQLFLDALERDLKKESMTKRSSTEAVREPALSFRYDKSKTLLDQLSSIIDNMPSKQLAAIADASTSSVYTHNQWDPNPSATAAAVAAAMAATHRVGMHGGGVPISIDGIAASSRAHNIQQASASSELQSHVMSGPVYSQQQGYGPPYGPPGSVPGPYQQRPAPMHSQNIMPTGRYDANGQSMSGAAQWGMPVDYQQHYQLGTSAPPLTNNNNNNNHNNFSQAYQTLSQHYAPGAPATNSTTTTYLDLPSRDELSRSHYNDIARPPAISSMDDQRTLQTQDQQQLHLHHHHHHHHIPNVDAEYSHTSHSHDLEPIVHDDTMRTLAIGIPNGEMSDFPLDYFAPPDEAETNHASSKSIAAGPASASATVLATASGSMHTMVHGPSSASTSALARPMRPMSAATGTASGNNTGRPGSSSIHKPPLRQRNTLASGNPSASLRARAERIERIYYPTPSESGASEASLIHGDDSEELYGAMLYTGLDTSAAGDSFGRY